MNLSQIPLEHLNEDLTDVFIFILRSENHRILRPNLIVKANDLVRKSTGHMLLILIREGSIFIARPGRDDRFHDRFEISVDNEGDFDYSVMILELNLPSFLRHFNFQLFIV